MAASIAYRLAAPERWAEIMAAGVFEGEVHDIEDGFIHLSAAEQVAGTLIKHYADFDRLLLVEIDLEALGDSVKWEKSRGGALFPHVYGKIPMDVVRGFRHVRRNEDGEWMLPVDLGDGN